MIRERTHFPHIDLHDVHVKLTNPIIWYPFSCKLMPYPAYVTELIWLVSAQRRAQYLLLCKFRKKLLVGSRLFMVIYLYLVVIYCMPCVE